MHINDLPAEVLQEIFSHLTVKEKFQNERVCRYWQENIFVSIQSLAFVNFSDAVCTHYVSEENLLPSDVNSDDELMTKIILKCGRYLRSYKGYASSATIQAIAQNCEHLHCTNMLFDDLKDLKLLRDTFREQLTCATIYINTWQGITPFVAACIKLTNLAILPTSRHPSAILSAEIFRFSHPLPLLRMLVIEIDSLYLTRRALQSLEFLNNLDVARIRLTHDLNHSLSWGLVIHSWSTLRSLSLELRSQNCMHFDPLPPNLEYLSLKLFASSHSCISRRAIKFESNLCFLKTLKIYVFKGSVLRELLLSVVSCCPQLEAISLDCSVWHGGLMDEHFSPLLSMVSLKLLNLGYQVVISDVFASNLIAGLDNLTQFGEYSKQDKVSLIPNGPLFWKSLITKAIARPLEMFRLVGEIKGVPSFSEPLPSNIFLQLRNNAE